MKRIVLIAAGFLLATATGLQAVRYFSSPAAEPPRPLREIVPTTIAGWTVHEEPLGPNESAARSAEKMLAMDEYVHRSFARGRVAFSIYAARWAHGRAQWQDVALHTPDACWVSNGWVCREKRSSAVLTVGGAELMPGQWREFVPPVGPPTRVMFWHVLGGRVIERNREERFAGFSESVRNLFGPRDDQYFVRISSASPLEELADNPGFEEAVAGLVRVVLGRNRGAGTQ